MRENSKFKYKNIDPNDTFNFEITYSKALPSINTLKQKIKLLGAIYKSEHEPAE